MTSPITLNLGQQTMKRLTIRGFAAYGNIAISRMVINSKNALFIEIPRPYDIATSPAANFGRRPGFYGVVGRIYY